MLVGEGSTQVNGTSAKSASLRKTPAALGRDERRETSSATLLTIISITSGERALVTGETSVATGSKSVAPVPVAVAEGFLPLFCFLVAGVAVAGAGRLLARLGGMTAKRTQTIAETEAITIK